jgi:3-hydroxyacyl-CoA dehydrogenase
MNQTVKAAGVEDSGCKRALVIGAGSMGAGIAAQFANAGVPVDLLDVPAPEGRNARAEAGIAAQIKARGFMGAAQAQLVTPGNVEDDLGCAVDADWIVEAVIEDLAIKRALFDRIEPLRKPSALVSSNTSTIPRAELIAGRSDAFADHFVISHFFNPPRYMELLELVGAQGTPAWEFAQRAGRDVLGKAVISCKDTPGFIANRIGCAWIAVAITEAVRLNLTVEEADAVQAAFGAPRTGIFGLMDLVGIDLIPKIWGSLMAALPHDDVINRFDLPSEPALRGMIDAGRHGRKSGAGFYRKTVDGSREALDLGTGTYRPLCPTTLPKDLKALVRNPSPIGRYAAALLTETLRYAAQTADEIAFDPDDIDAAMCLGYAWREGPFALMARLGDTLDLGALPTPALRRSDEAQSRLAIAKSGTRLAGNDSASLWDVGGDLTALEFHTQMNAVDMGTLDMIEAALERLAGPSSALVIGNDNPRAFCAGANLAAIAAMIDSGDTAGIEAFIRRGQRLYSALRLAAAPVVSAVIGVALGGGCELLLHSDDVVLHAEAQLGLPESTLGLLPAWGGCVRMLERAAGPRGPVATARTAMDTLLARRPFGSVREAVAAGLVPTNIVMHRAPVFDLAAARAEELAEGYAPPVPAVLHCGGRSAAAGLMTGPLALHKAGALGDPELEVARRIAGVLTGGPEGDRSQGTTEADIHALECEAFVALAMTPHARARIGAMI